MLKNAGFIAHSNRSHYARRELRHCFLSCVTAALRPRCTHAVRLEGPAQTRPFSRDNGGSPYHRNNGNFRTLSSSVHATGSACIGTSVATGNVSTSICPPGTRSLRQIHTALHTEAAHARAQQPHSPRKQENSIDDDDITTAALPDSLDTRSSSGSNSFGTNTNTRAHTHIMEIDEADEKWELSIMKEEMYEDMLEDLRVAMSYNSPIQMRSRSIAWTEGYTGEKPKEKVERERSLMRARRRREGTMVELGEQDDYTIERTKTSDDYQPRWQEPSSSPDLLSNPLLKHVLPIYYRNEHLRLARTRRNDLRNLSYLEAEAKLGMASELYLGTSFVSGKTRGGRGKETERWRAKMTADRFERETSEKPTWMKERVKGKGKRDARRDRRRVQERRNDSFADVWGDLAAKILP